LTPRIHRGGDAAGSGSSDCAFLFWLAGGRAGQPLLLAIILMSTSAGLLLPLMDAGEATTEFGQPAMMGAAVAEIVPILLL
jgi:hypothetical protein